MAHEEDIENGPATTESVITALQKVITLLDRIKNAIEDSSSKIPNASVQLNTVTEATELATVEILDVLDRMAAKIHFVESGMNTFDEKSMTPEQRTTFQELKTAVNELHESTSNITVALQVQDITAQKISAANHLIETVRKELLNELNYFETAKKKTDDAKRHMEEEINVPKHFDMNASYMKTPEHQSKIDEVVLAWQENEKK